MLRISFMFILLLASVSLGVILQQDPGYILVRIHQWTLETTLWVGITALILIFLLLHFLLFCWETLSGLPEQWREKLTQHRVHQSQIKTRQGLIEFSEGHWLSAKNNLIKALPNADTPLLNYLTAARAAQELGDNKLRDHYLRQAQCAMPEAKIAVELTQAQLQLAHEQWEQALATLRHLQDLSPKHPYVLKLLMHLYEEINDWEQLHQLLPVIKKRNILSKPEYHKLEKRIFIALLTDKIQQNIAVDIHHLISELPKELRYDADINHLYCYFLIKNHDDNKAEGQLRACLQKSFHPKLIELYGQLQTKTERLQFAESLLKHHADEASLYLCLGRLCAQQQLWGKARQYFEFGLRLEPKPTLYVELGELLEKMHEPNEACNMYHQGLLSVISNKTALDSTL